MSLGRPGRRSWGSAFMFQEDHRGQLRVRKGSSDYVVPRGSGSFLNAPPLPSTPHHYPSFGQQGLLGLELSSVLKRPCVRSERFPKLCAPGHLAASLLVAPALPFTLLCLRTPCLSASLPQVTRLAVGGRRVSGGRWLPSGPWQQVYFPASLQEGRCGPGCLLGSAHDPAWETSRLIYLTAALSTEELLPWVCQVGSDATTFPTKPRSLLSPTEHWLTAPEAAGQPASLLLCCTTQSEPMSGVGDSSVMGR